MLREMRWQDIAQLSELESALFGTEAWDQSAWWAELAQRPRRSYVVATEGSEASGEGSDSAPIIRPAPEGRITGYAGLDHGGEVADVMTIAVAPGEQGRGTGALLLRHLFGCARGRGASFVMLEVRADNPRAKRLYERFGFGVLQTRRRYYQPDDVDALVMRADLEEVTHA